MTRQSKQLHGRLREPLGRICRGLTVLGLILLSGAASACAIYFVGSTIIKLLAR